MVDARYNFFPGQLTSTIDQWGLQYSPQSVLLNVDTAITHQYVVQRSDVGMKPARSTLMIHDACVP